MLLYPKKIKFRKWQTGRTNANKKPNATRGTTVAFGSHGVKATSEARVTSNQIEAARKVVSRTIGKTGRMWVRIFPDRPVTKKPSEVKMGKGKGDPDHFCVVVLPGRVMFEVDGVSDEIANEAMRKAGTKLPVSIKIVTRT